MAWHRLAFIDFNYWFLVCSLLCLVFPMLCLPTALLHFVFINFLCFNLEIFIILYLTCLHHLYKLTSKQFVYNFCCTVNLWGTCPTQSTSNEHLTKRKYMYTKSNTKVFSKSQVDIAINEPKHHKLHKNVFNIN